MNISSLDYSNTSSWGIEKATPNSTRNKTSRDDINQASLTSSENELLGTMTVLTDYDNLLLADTTRTITELDFGLDLTYEENPVMEILNPNSVAPFGFDQIQSKAPRAFQPRKQHGQRLSLSMNFVLCTLRSYPSMVLSGTTSPPFIHARFLANRASQNSKDTSMPRPLAICMAITQMFSVKNKENTVFIWKTIRMEQERLATECAYYNEIDTVAALQAITIYFLLRVSENDENATDFDIPLIQTMQTISYRARDLRIRFIDQPLGRKMTWETWVLAESLRRTIITIFLIDMFFDITPGLLSYKCDGSEFAQMILPCTRKVWKSSTASEWEREFSIQCDATNNSNHLTYGDLRKSQFTVDKADFEQRMNNWLGQVDEFGSLIVAAASLHEGNVI